jgi:antitoxin component HigA of HigAB toxin-antitoxin module
MRKKRKRISLLRSDTEYHLAMSEIERCFDREPKTDSTPETLLDSLATVIEADERERRQATRQNRTRKKDAYSSFSVVK